MVAIYGRLERVGLSLLLVVLAGAMAVPAAGQQTGADKTPLLENLVPAGTLAIFSAPDVGATVKNFRQTITGKFVEYFFSEDFKKLLRHLGVKPGERRGGFPDLRKEMDDGVRKATGMTLDELLGLFTGECAFSLVGLEMTAGDEGEEGFGPPPVKIDAVVKIGWNDAAKGAKLLSKLLEKAPRREETAIGGFKAITVDPNPMATPTFVVTPSCLIIGTQTETVKAVLAAIKSGKPVDKPLTSDTEYQMGVKNTRTDRADIFFYGNWEKIREFPMLRTALEANAPDLLDDLGLASLKSVSYTFAIKDCQMTENLFFHVPKGERKGILKIVSTPRTETADGIRLTGTGDITGINPYVSGIVPTAIIAAIAVPSLMKSQMASNEKSAIGSIKQLRDQEIVFRNEDSDRNGQNDYWTLDVSGLCRVLNAAGTQIGKIEIPLAMADGAPIAPIANYVGAPLTARPVPKAGYLFRAMTTDENGNPYNQNEMGDGTTKACHARKFAFCAYPAVYEQTGKNIFIVSEEGTIWKKDTGNNEPILQWPAANPKTAGWSYFD